MDANELTKQYFKYIKICGLSIGLWPYQTRWKSYLSQGIIYTIFISGVFTQLSKVIHFYSFKVLVEEIPFLGVGILGFTKYINYVANNLRFQHILTSLSMDWKSLNSNMETEIMQLYVRRSVLFGSLYKLNVYFACVTFGGLPSIPFILDIINPLNESRPRLLVYPAHYYVDEAQYYYYLLLHTLLCMCVAAIVILFSDCMLIYLVQHACAVLSVAGWRFKHVTDNIHYSCSKKLHTSDIVFRKLCESIESHNRAIVIVNEIESIYVVNLFIQVGIAVMGFSVTLVIIATTSFSADMYAVYGFIIVQIVHLLFLTIQGQFIRNSFDDLYNQVTDGLWYLVPPKLQSFYILALRRNLTPPILTAGGLITLDLNSFTEILKASFSYYTVLRSD